MMKLLKVCAEAVRSGSVQIGLDSEPHRGLHMEGGLDWTDGPSFEVRTELTA